MIKIVNDSGDFNIEIDFDEDRVTLIKPSGVAYDYSIQELEGKGIIDNLVGGGAKGTVYSQGEVFTLEEYLSLFGISPVAKDAMETEEAEETEEIEEVKGRDFRLKIPKAGKRGRGGRDFTDDLADLRKF